MPDASTPEEPCLLDKLRQRASVGKEMSQRPNLTGGSVRLWSASVRHLLGRIFGKDSTTVDAFPAFANSVPEGRVKETILERLASLETLLETVTASAEKALMPYSGDRVFIGHGRSPLWRELKDFVHDRLHLPWDEFNRESVAGVAGTERLDKMLSDATFAFLIMTAEDEHADATLHARENVIHEVGLFQGKLGLKRAIILKEEGCQVFSNIHGLTYIGFPKGNIGAAFEQIRLVLEREQIIKSRIS